MVGTPPSGAITTVVSGDTTGTVTGDPPNDATGDLDATVTAPPSWSIFTTVWEITDPPDHGTASIGFFNGTWTYEVDPAFFATLDNGDIVTDTFVVRGVGLAWNPGGQLRSGDDFVTVSIEIEGVCFTAGTLIATPDGSVPVEDLRPGDLLCTRDRGPQPIRAVDAAHLDAVRLAKEPELRPIRIARGALRSGCPARDLRLSPQHRVLVSGPAVELLFGVAEVLVPAKALINWRGVETDEAANDVTYIHLLLDRHEILDAEGTPAESLFLGEEALGRMGSEALQELAAIFPAPPGGVDAGFGQAARMILKDHEARLFVDSAAEG